MKGINKRIIAIVLIFVVFLTNLPVAIFASDIEGSMECTYLKNAQIYTVVRDEIKTEECSQDLIKT